MGRTLVVITILVVLISLLSDVEGRRGGKRERRGKWQILPLATIATESRGRQGVKSGLLTQPSTHYINLHIAKGGPKAKGRHHRPRCVIDSDCAKVQFAFCFLRKCRKSLPAGGTCVTNAWCDSGKCANNICT